jgi:hypothetical protein
MARLRPTHVINVLTFEEKTRVTNFFKLLVEIDVRLPKTTKPKIKRGAKQKNKSCPIKLYATCIEHKTFPPCCLSKTARRDLFFNFFNTKKNYYISLFIT